MATPLKKRLESLFKTLVEAELTAQALTCTVVKGHDITDKINLPYLTVLCESTNRDPSMPVSSYSYIARMKVLAVWDVDAIAETGKSEANMNDYLMAADHAMRKLADIQTETQANYTDLHVHLSAFVGEISENDGETIHYDGWDYDVILEYIDPPA